MRRQGHPRQGRQWLAGVAAVLVGLSSVAAAPPTASQPSMQAGATTAPAPEPSEPDAGAEQERLLPLRLPLGPAFQDQGLVRFLDLAPMEEYKELFLIDYRVRHYCHSKVVGQGRTLAMTRQDFGLYAPLLPDRPPVWTACLKYHRLDVDGGATLPNTASKLPNRFQDVQLGTRFGVPLSMGAIDVTFGSPSDKPFDSADEISADITYMFGLPFKEEGFLVLVNYSNNREYLNRCILPGFVYRAMPSERFRTVLGFPYSGVRWAVADWLSINAEYDFPRTVYSQLALHFGRAVKLYAGFDWTNQRYFRHDRRRRDDRLFYYEKRLAAGLRWDLGEHGYVEIFGGYAFDRMFFEADRYEDRGRNRISIKDGPFLGLQAGLRF